MNSQNNIIQKLFLTDEKVHVTFLRLAVGIVMFPHGAQKLLGWFGGYGFHGTMGFFTSSLGIPEIFAFLAIVAEFFGSIALITGFLSRIAAFGIGINLLVAVFMIHIHNGFFMNWAGNQAGEGIEYFIYAISLSAIITIIGGGAYSVDSLIAKRLGEKSVKEYKLQHSS
jgi:putative oxidoreductase